MSTSTDEPARTRRSRLDTVEVGGPPRVPILVLVPQQVLMLALARRIVAIAFAIAAWPAFAALVADDLKPLADEAASGKLVAIERLVASGDPRAAAILTALKDDSLAVTPQGAFVITGGSGPVDALTGATASVDAASLDAIAINNRIRGRIDAALAAFDLLAPERSVRARAIAALEKAPDPALAGLIDAAAARETDADLKPRLALLQSAQRLASGDRAVRLEAITQLGASENPATRLILLPIVEKAADGTFREADAELRGAAERAIRSIDAAQRKGELAGAVFTGLSLGSVLLLAALGLAITYGLMGVINMAHGEFLMIGAYATFVVQNLFRQHLPGAIDWYLAAALPAAFACAFLLGVVLERTVVRFLYGRPLETLLATYGVSLLIIQATRTLFGAQNVEVANPSWMSGGIQLLPNLMLPWNRIAIIAFALVVVAAVWAVLNLTRLGLFVRAVTQNRAMAGCVGVHTSRVDTMAFGLGAGVAGLGGVALSQVGNVGPDLGQAYIVDSFMAVVLGGVGQLAGTVVGSFGLGIVNKFLEPFTGAVLAKIAVLVLIVLFIQRRPQGLFALKGRAAEA
jgi:urea transport system permease protein